MGTCQPCKDRRKYGLGPCPTCTARHEARERHAADTRAAASQRYRDAENRVLARAARLDPADHSLEAQQVRETAGSVRDHRAAEAARGLPEHGHTT